MGLTLPSDLIDLWAAFDDEKTKTEKTKTEYLLVGGQAVALHGHPRFTKDADLWVRDTAANIGACQRAWRSRVTLVVEGVPVEVVGRDELIRLKRASGRPQDLVAADLLEASAGA